MSALWPMMTPALDADDSRCIVSAQGHRLRYADGSELLCGTSGLWNVNLGYGNEAIAQRVAETLRTNSYASVFRSESTLAREAAERLLDATAHPFAKVIFTVSGGSANDAVMKLARQHHELGGDPGRKIVVGLKDSYHGLTFGAHALTGESLGQRSYGVDTRLVRHVPANDVPALEALFASAGRQIAAIVVEPLLGNGALPLESAYIARLGELADATGALLVADEVATGFGRTGPMFASDAWERQPDVLATSKGLTNGTMPASAILVRDVVADRFTRTGAMLLHGETQAGTAVTAAAICATLDEFERLHAVAAGREVSAALDVELARWQATDPGLLRTRGAGCFRAVTLEDPRNPGQPLPQSDVLPLMREIRRAGAQVHAGMDGVQLIPALTYSTDEVEELIAAVRTGISAYTGRTAHRVGVA